MEESMGTTPSPETPRAERAEGAERRPTREAPGDIGVARAEARRDSGAELREGAEADVVAAERAAERRTKRGEIVRPPDETGVKVERVLEDNLWTVYLDLPAEQRAKFKSLGEETARAIRAMLVQSRIRANKIHAAVLKWLKTIPDVNKYFLLQESKIKTDVFLKLAEAVAAKLRG